MEINIIRSSITLCRVTHTNVPNWITKLQGISAEFSIFNYRRGVCQCCIARCLLQVASNHGICQLSFGGIKSLSDKRKIEAYETKSHTYAEWPSFSSIDDSAPHIHFRLQSCCLYVCSWRAVETVLVTWISRFRCVCIVHTRIDRYSIPKRATFQRAYQAFVGPLQLL